MEMFNGSEKLVALPIYVENFKELRVPLSEAFTRQCDFSAVALKNV